MTAKMKWREWMPGLMQFRGYQSSWLRGDALAGVTVAAYLVPQVMAYATIAGLAPVVGLWASLVPLALYAVFGSSRQLSVGPESTTALMTGLCWRLRPPGIRNATECWRPPSRWQSASSAWQAVSRGSASSPICCRDQYWSDT